jgi:hypothetical protein
LERDNDGRGEDEKQKVTKNQIYQCYVAGSCVFTFNWNPNGNRIITRGFECGDKEGTADAKVPTQTLRIKMNGRRLLCIAREEVAAELLRRKQKIRPKNNPLTIVNHDL